MSEDFKAADTAPVDTPAMFAPPSGPGLSGNAIVPGTEGVLFDVPRNPRPRQPHEED